MEIYTEKRNKYLIQTVNFISEKGWDCKNEIYYEDNRPFFFMTLFFSKIKIEIYCNELYREINLQYATLESDWYESDELDRIVKRPLELEKMDVRNNFDDSYQKVLDYVDKTLSYMSDPKNWILG